MDTRFRLLNLDPVEDRAVPSHGHAALDPPGLTVVIASLADPPSADHRGQGEDEPRGPQGQGRGASEGRGPQAGENNRGNRADDRVVVLLPPPAPTVTPPPGQRSTPAAPVGPPAADRAVSAGSDRPVTRVVVAEPLAEAVRRGEVVSPESVADLVRRGESGVVVPPLVPTGHAIPVALRAATGAAWPLATTASSPTLPNDGSAPASPLATVPGATDEARPDAITTAQAGTLAASPDPAAEPATEAATAPPSEPAAPAAPAEPAAPPRSVVGRVVEAIFPAGGPLGGALPVDLIAVEADAAELLAGLAGLGDSGPDGWAGPERWAWLTAAVLTVGGVGYTALGDARGRRRAGPVALATDSALARWEERNGDGTG